MGQKINPVGLRVGIIRGWDSRWYQQKNYASWLHQDLKIRNYIMKTHRQAGITRVEIERANKVHVIINTAKPGLVIGRKGTGIEELKKSLMQFVPGKQINISVQEVKQHDLEATLVAENIADALMKRVTFRRAMKQATQRVMKAGAKGIRVQVSGRLGGAEIARSERAFLGKVPLHTLRADIDYAIREANTTYGTIGVKVWIYRGDILPQRNKSKAN
ncbi:MAG: 30S ribosomal protein S3 [bacterium]|nr:30S ribosomal protein S3 [bacterium]